MAATIARSTMKRLFRAVVLLPLCGCVAVGVEPRSADLTEPGRFGAAGTFSVFGLAKTDTDVRFDNGTTAQNDEVLAMRDAVHPLLILGSPLYNTQGRLRIGLYSGLELYLEAGFQQRGGEIRVAALDEDDGAPLSLAVSGGAAWRPFMDVGVPWAQLGLQVSRRFDAITPLANVYASWGPETHGLFLDEALRRDCAGFGSEGCGEFGAPTHLLIHRAELRIHLPLGFSYTIDDFQYDGDNDFDAFFADDYVSRSLHYDKPGGPIITFAVTPYIIAWSGDIAAAECVGCSYAVPTSLDARFGGTLTVGLRSLDW